MAVVYATLSQLKTRPRITDTDDDALLFQALSAASRMIDRRCGRTFGLEDIASARVFSLSGRVARAAEESVVLVDDIGSVTGLTVELGDGSSWSSTVDCELWPDNALAHDRPITGLTFAHGVAARKVRVMACWGWPEIPAEIVEATLIQASRLFARKDSPEGVAGSGEWGMIRLSRIDPDVDALLQPFVLPGFG